MDRERAHVDDIAAYVTQRETTSPYSRSQLPRFVREGRDFLFVFCALLCDFLESRQAGSQDNT